MDEDESWQYNIDNINNNAIANKYYEYISYIQNVLDEDGSGLPVVAEGERRASSRALLQGAAKWRHYYD